MSQPSPTIKGFLQQAEDGLALLRSKATPRKKSTPEGSASVQVSRLLRESPEGKDAQEQLELQARTMLGLDRRLRGFDARFKSLEKAIASAAELAAASSRCGRDGIEAATAAAAAVRVEAEAKCRDLSKRIDSLSRPHEDTGRVQEWHGWQGEDLHSIERRLRSQLEQRVDEASESIAAELKAEVQMELAAFREDLSLSRPSPGKHERADSALERRLITAEEDLRRAVHGVAELENRVQGEERVYWTVVQALEQRVGSLEACSNQLSVEDRMGKLEAQIARLLDRVGSPQPRRPPSVTQDPVRRPGVLASMALASPEIQAEVVQAPRLQEPEHTERLVERVGRHIEPRMEPAEAAERVAEVVSPPPASPASSSSAPSPHLRGVPFQPPVRRHSRLIPGSLRLGSSEPEESGKSGRPSTTQRPVQMIGSHGDAADSQSPQAEAAQPVSMVIPQVRRADSSGSSSPTFSDSANLSELLRSTSAMARSEGMSSGSRSPMVTVVTQPLPAQAAQGVRAQGAQETIDDEPICAFSTNVSEDGFKSGDELNLP